MYNNFVDLDQLRIPLFDLKLNGDNGNITKSDFVIDPTQYQGSVNWIQVLTVNIMFLLRR